MDVTLLSVKDFEQGLLDLVLDEKSNYIIINFYQGWWKQQLNNTQVPFHLFLLLLLVFFL